MSQHLNLFETSIICEFNRNDNKKKYKNHFDYLIKSSIAQHFFFYIEKIHL